LLCVALPVAAKEVVCLGGSECVASHGVDGEEHRGGDGDDDVSASPLPSEVLKQAGLAGGAGVAELFLFVAPGGAVGVGVGVDRADPVGWGDEGVAASRRRLAAAGLHGAEPGGGEEFLRRGRGVRLVEVGASGGSGEARLDPVPASRRFKAGAQPAGGRVVVEVVLEEGPAWWRVARGAAGDDEDEDGEAGERGNEEEHGDEVGEEEPWQAPECADEAGEADGEDGDAEGDEGPLEDLDAGVVGQRGQPDAGSDDRDGQERCEEVDGRRAHVVERHCFLFLAICLPGTRYLILSYYRSINWLD
jgi:hypothetical protein